MSKYFKPSELACKCHRCAGQDNTGPVGIDSHLYEVLDKIRERVGKPVYINSGYRCPEHNEEVGGSPNSQHKLGIAADIRWEGINPVKDAKIAFECGADGIGVYASFLHVDVRGYKARWRG